jgi:hypothetical protein
MGEGAGADLAQAVGFGEVFDGDNGCHSFLVLATNFSHEFIELGEFLFCHEFIELYEFLFFATNFTNYTNFLNLREIRVIRGRFWF